MKYIKNFENIDQAKSYVDSNQFNTPSIIQSENIVMYYTDDPKPGDILLGKTTEEDGITKYNKMVVSPEMYKDKYEDDSSWTPIGIVVIPKKYSNDGKTRCVSIRYMCTGSREAYSSGTINSSQIMFGDVAGVPQSIQRINTFRIYVPGTTTLSTTAGWSYLPSSSNSGFSIANPDDTYTKYNKLTNSLPSAGVDKLYSIYCDSGYVLSDLNGFYNTKEILDNTQADWSDTITNDASSGNFPAAFACAGFCPAGTATKDWYLPSIGELGFLIIYKGIVDSARIALGYNAIPSLYLISSSMRDNDNIWSVISGDGQILGTGNRNMYCFAFIEL